MNFFEINLENIKEIKQKKNFAFLTNNLPEVLISNRLFEEDVAETILEGVSKEQKEIAQRAMAKENMKILNRLKNYLDNKWKNKKKTKEDYLQARKEYGRLTNIIKNFATLSAESDPEIKSYLKNVIGDVPQWLTLKSDNRQSGFSQNGTSMPAVILSTGKIDDIKPIDYGFKNTDDKKLKILIRQEIALHEYGHLFDFLVKAIETGLVPEPKDTKNLFLNKKIQELEDLEGKANDYALNSIYRKDRRELLKNSSLDYKEEVKNKNKIEQIKNGTYDGKVGVSEVYRSGTFNNSKALRKTLKSIRLEKAQNSLQLKKINSYAKIICERFRKIGYNVPAVICKVRDNYIEQKGDFYPLFTNENESVIFVDVDAYEDLARNKLALMFYLPHEVAHIISNEGHNGANFKKCINDWNKTYPEKILADPEDEDVYNKKFLPTYFKKSSWYDKQKDAKVADEGMKKEIWR